MKTRILKYNEWRSIFEGQESKIVNYRIFEQKITADNIMNLKKLPKELKEEAISIKKLGEFSLDSGQLILIDPCYLDKIEYDVEKMNAGDYKGPNKEIKVGKAGKGVYLSLFGGDGTFEVLGKYNKDAEWPHIPFEVTIKVRSEDINEGAWGHGPLDNDSASDWKWKFGDLIIKELKDKIKSAKKDIKTYHKSSYKSSYLYYSIGMWEFLRDKLKTNYSFFTDDEVREMNKLTVECAQLMLDNPETYHAHKDPKIVKSYLEDYINKTILKIEEAAEYVETEQTKRSLIPGHPTGKHEEVPIRFRDADTKTLRLFKFIYDSGKEGRSHKEIVKFLMNPEDPESVEYDWREDRGYWSTNLYGSGSYSGNLGLLTGYCEKNEKGRWILKDEKLKKYFLRRELKDAFDDAGYEDIGGLF